MANQVPANEEDVRLEASASPEQDLDTIKEILFGAQVRQSADAQQQLESRLVSAINGLRDDTRLMFDQVQRSLDELNTRLDQQAAHQNRENQALLKNIEENQQEAHNDAGIIQEDLQELKRELTNKDFELQEDIDCKYHQLEALLKREVDNLQSQKADRNSLATLLTGIADQLSAADAQERDNESR